ncbi:MAG: carbon-nitrogen family hydrolase [Thermodesulfovibrionales bacterium]
MIKHKVAVIQFETLTGRPDINLDRTESFIEEAAESGSSLVCFPEMWTTGFDWQYLTDERSIHNQVIDEVMKLAKQYNIWINGSMPYVDSTGRIFNRSILFSPDGRICGTYDKIHLFRLIGEDRYLSAGDRLSIIDAPWGKTGLAICYDLRFPELFRLYAMNSVDVIIICAAFPDVRINHWRTLVRARAIENQMYVIGVNRVGSENDDKGMSISFGGHSMIVDPWGEVVSEEDNLSEATFTGLINKELVDQTRARLPVLSDKRDDIYQICMF